MAGLADLFGAGRGINPALTGILAQLAPTLAQSAQRPMTPVDPTEAAINEIIQRQYTPEPVVDQPVPAQSKLWQRILSGIADAGSVYAAGISPGVRPTNFAANLMGQDYQAKDIAAGNLDRRMKARTEAERRGDELKLRQLIEKRSSEIASQADAADKAAKVAADKMKREQELADIAAKRAFDEKMKKAEFAHDEALARLRLQEEGGNKGAKEQIKLLGDAKGLANDIANGLDSMLKGWTDEKGVQHPPMTMQEIKKRYVRDLNAMNLSPDARAAALAYFLQEVEANAPDSLLEFGAPEIK